MTVTVTNTTLTAFNTEVVLTNNPATSTVADATQVFNITPTKADYKVLIEIVNGPTHGAVAWSIAAGDYWAAGSTKTGSVAQATTEVIMLEGAKYKTQAGVIAITLTPASGKRLLTDHAAAVNCIQIV
jgi:hypothetical protein